MHTCTTIDSQNWSVVNVTSRAAIHKLHYDLWDRRNYETPSISAVNYSSSYMLVSYCHHRGIIPLINIINNLYAVYFWIFTVWWDDYFIFRRHMWVLKCKLFDLLEWTGIRWTTLTCSKRVCIITVKCTSYTRYSIIIASTLHTINFNHCLYVVYEAIVFACILFSNSVIFRSLFSWHSFFPCIIMQVVYT